MLSFRPQKSSGCHVPRNPMILQVLPGEPKTFIFGDYDPYIEGLKPSFFHGFGVQR